jgi:hypothetical protein
VVAHRRVRCRVRARNTGTLGLAAGARERRRDAAAPRAQVIGCNALLEIPYYRRRRLCKDHANRLELIHHGVPFRFCQARPWPRGP